MGWFNKKMKDIINKIEIKESELIPKLKWLAESPNNGLEDIGLNIVVRHLLKQVEIQKLRIDLLVQEIYQLKKK